MTKTPTVVHGGVTEEELATYRLRGISLVDLSANLNPYGPLTRVLDAAGGAIVERYPEPDSATLCRAYAEFAGVAPAQVLAGSGSTELLYLLARAFLASGERCLIVGPTFGEYAAAAATAGADLRFCTAMQVDGSVNVCAMLRAIEESRPALVYLCNPNNPTGALLSPPEIEQITRAVQAAGGRLIVDEAYIDFASPLPPMSHPAAGHLVVRSLTKLHTIPGLRVGFLLGIEEDVDRVARHRPAWAVSAPATAAALAALNESRFAEESVRRVMATRGWLIERLRKAGFAVADSHANFVLVDVGNAKAFRARLMDEGFVVRDCTSFALPHHVRIAIPSDDYAEPLVRAFERLGS